MCLQKQTGEEEEEEEESGRKVKANKAFGSRAKASHYVRNTGDSFATPTSTYCLKLKNGKEGEGARLYAVPLVVGR